MEVPSVLGRHKQLASSLACLSQVPHVCGGEGGGRIKQRLEQHFGRQLEQHREQWEEGREGGRDGMERMREK